MADDNSIIEGNVKFRDGKKWKSRWCVMRKLSPVADCVQLQLYRDARARSAGGGCKASLALAHFVAAEAGFTLDKHSHTLALVCQDLVAVLAFDTRERLMQWQVKVSLHLGAPRQYLVLVAAGGALPAGPARLHVPAGRLALTAGAPPRLLGLWALHHLRRFGVVEGRFCFEGGALCGAAGGLHAVLAERAPDIARDVAAAAALVARPRNGMESPRSQQAFRPGTRLSELNTIDQSLPPLDLRHYEDSRAGDEAGAISPYWPSTDRSHFQDMGLGDTSSVNETVDGTDTDPWSNPNNVTIERCMSCISKLGALSRSSTAALTPGAKHFNPAWTMEAVEETPLKNEPPTDDTQSCDINNKKPNKTEEPCRCPERPPDRPPKPTRLDLNFVNKPKPPMPPPSQACGCPHFETEDKKLSRIGPYENYDVPRLPSAEIEGEYYDTPKRLKECLNKELFRMTKSSTMNSLVLKKPCGCLLRFGRRPREPTVIDADDSFQPAGCPCRRVTDWANDWIRLPYCRRNTASADNLAPNKENARPAAGDRGALYATIDLSRKTRRKSRPYDPRSDGANDRESERTNDRGAEIDVGPLANYENLNFALSLEHYENAKDLLKRAGVTQTELDAIAANLRPALADRSPCARCGNPQGAAGRAGGRSPGGDDYLMMEPNGAGAARPRPEAPRPPAGYTPMSPIAAVHAPRLPARTPGPVGRLLDEKSASNPALGPPAAAPRPHAADRPGTETTDRPERRERSRSADSSRFLEDLEEFEGSAGSASSIETLRNIAVDGDGASTPDERSARGRSDGCGAARARRSSSVPGAAAGNRDSSSSNDSGVSSCSLRRRGAGAGAGGAFELPATTAAARRHYRSARRAAADDAPPSARARRSRSSGSTPARAPTGAAPAKSSSAEAEVPVLTVKPLRGVVDTHSTSSGTSDMSDYIETLSICSSHSSSDAPITMRVVRQTTSTLRPRSGKEYGSLDPRLTSVYRSDPHHY